MAHSILISHNLYVLFYDIVFLYVKMFSVVQRVRMTLLIRALYKICIIIFRIYSETRKPQIPKPTAHTISTPPICLRDIWRVSEITIRMFTVAAIINHSSIEPKLRERKLVLVTENINSKKRSTFLSAANQTNTFK